jgi:hypothetical protein
LTIGPVTIERIAAATVSSASRFEIPAAFSGFEASTMRLPASASENGAVAAATPGRSTRR